ncbi:hypothetical protein HMPREF1572_01173 [Gardnerella vaginalis JCP7275]|nr:hypothetical protein HMPREF1572_01173 [Gardnerella vaginalis JCP7275]
MFVLDFPEFVYVLGRVGNESGDDCLSLFTYWVEWETKAGVLACVCLCFGWFWEQTWAWRRRECRNTRERFSRVCLRIGLSGKQKREHFPEFVYVLGDFGNKRGRGEDVSAAIRANDNDAVNSTRRGANLAKIRKEFLTILITC